MACFQTPKASKHMRVNTIGKSVVTHPGYALEEIVSCILQILLFWCCGIIVLLLLSLYRIVSTRVPFLIY